MPTPQDYTGQIPTWCPGCVNFPILKTLKEVFAELGMEPHRYVLVSGIGQAAKLPHYMKGNGFPVRCSQGRVPAEGGVEVSKGPGRDVSNCWWLTR